MEKHTFVGFLKNNDKVFYSPIEGFAIEKDFEYLVKPTSEESAEIHKTFPHPIPDGPSCPTAHCVWQLDTFCDWNTTCGTSVVLDDGTPEENKMIFCAYCGKPLAQRIIGEED